MAGHQVHHYRGIGTGYPSWRHWLACVWEGSPHSHKGGEWSSPCWATALPLMSEGVCWLGSHTGAGLPFEHRLGSYQPPATWLGKSFTLTWMCLLSPPAQSCPAHVGNSVSGSCFPPSGLFPAEEFAASIGSQRKLPHLVCLLWNALGGKQQGFPFHSAPASIWMQGCCLQKPWRKGQVQGPSHQAGGVLQNLSQEWVEVYSVTGTLGSGGRAGKGQC